MLNKGGAVITVEEKLPEKLDDNSYIFNLLVINFVGSEVLVEIPLFYLGINCNRYFMIRPITFSAVVNGNRYILIFPVSHHILCRCFAPLPIPSITNSEYRWLNRAE